MGRLAINQLLVISTVRIQTSNTELISYRAASETADIWSDEFFGAEVLSGCHSTFFRFLTVEVYANMFCRKLDTIPDKLPISSDAVKDLMDENTLDEALSAGNLFSDFRILKHQANSSMSIIKS